MITIPGLHDNRKQTISWAFKLVRKFGDFTLMLKQDYTRKRRRLGLQPHIWVEAYFIRAIFSERTKVATAQYGWNCMKALKQ